MKTLRITLIIIIGVVMVYCSNPTDQNSSVSDSTSDLNNESTYILNHTILNNQVYDAPIKTQVKLDVLIIDTAITKQKVSDLLSFFQGVALYPYLH